MGESTYRCSSNRAPRSRQQERKSYQSFVLPSGGRLAVALVGCLLVVTWTLPRHRTPSPISTESVNLPHHAPAQVVVFDLFRYYRQNRSVSDPVHRRRRGLLGYSHHIILNEEEQEEQPVDDDSDFTSLKKRSPGYDHEAMEIDDDGEASSSSLDPIGECPVFGGTRVSEAEIVSFFVKVGLGYGSQMREFFLSVDSGSGGTWVNCKGKGPISDIGPNGLFYPKRGSFLNCQNHQLLCEALQEGVDFPCDKMHRFRCLFDYYYGDTTDVQGSIVVGGVSFDLRDGSQRHASLAFGCAQKVTVGGVTENVVQRLAPYDGLMGLGPNPGGWLLQLNLLDVISEYVIAVCLEPEIGHLSSGPGSSVLEHVGFISFGDLYTRQAANIAWTAAIPPKSADHSDNDNLYSAMLVGIKYRNKVHIFDTEVEMGFDTGSDLTYLTKDTFYDVLDILNEDALEIGYMDTPDAYGGVGGVPRNCWEDITDGRESSVKHFGDLIMMFSSPGGDDTTSDFVIKPEHYITSGGDPNQPRYCFNMRLEPEDDGFDYGNLGGEAMRGHLLLFKEQPGQMNPSALIGWSSVASCKNLK